MSRSRMRRSLFALAFVGLVPLVMLGCPKKPPPATEEPPPPPPPPPATTMTLAPLEEDAGSDAAVDGAGDARKWTGPGYNPNQLKIMACCGAMRQRAAQLGPFSPEGAQLKVAAGQCDVLGRQAGPSGNAPEFAQLRGILGGVSLPAACNL
ncbi:MAG: hypothetical protein WCI05_11300 [Myxococcales bacterium]|jgi:hypothetical protein